MVEAIKQPRVTVQELAELAASLPPHLWPGARTLAISFAVIRRFLGVQWTEQQFASEQVGAKPGYFTLDSSENSTNESRERAAYRAYHFAELIMNLQTVDGFEERVDELLTADARKVESTFAELQVAGMLYQQEIPFRFVIKKPNPPRGEDYDFEVLRYPGHVVNVEAKCKLEGTEPKADSVLQSLRWALRQVPKDQPASIFVKIPAAWFVAGRFLSLEIVVRTADFLRQTTRTISVVYYTPFVAVADGVLTERHRWREMVNLKSRFHGVAPSVFNKPDGETKDRGWGKKWIRLSHFIKGPD